MSATISFVSAHWGVLLPIVLWVINDIANAARKYPQVQTRLHILMDLLSAHANDDSPHSMKLPFTRSKDPTAMVPLPADKGASTIQVGTLLPLAFIALGLAGLAFAAGGCASALDIAVEAKGAAAKALQSSAMAWVDYDRVHQLELVDAAPDKAAAHQALYQYREKVQAPVSKAMHAADAALGVLDGAIGAAKAGKQSDLAGVIQKAMDAITDLRSALAFAGVQLPALLGGSK